MDELKKRGRPTKPKDAKVITIKVPCDALAGSITLISGSAFSINLKTRTFDFQPHGNDEIDFTDKEDEE